MTSEKLIGEIALLFCDLCKGFNVESGDCMLGYSPRPCPGSRVPAHRAITLILSSQKDRRVAESRT